jgi:hypothetical protein
VPIHSLSSTPGWGTPEVAYKLGVSVLDLVQVYPQFKKRSLGHRKILYKLDTCLLRCLCYARQGSQHAVAVWGLSATTRHRKRGLFLWNLSQRENPRVASGGMREEVCTLYRWGHLAPERQLFFWAWRLKASNCCVGGRNSKVALWMHYLKY